jgi:predicted dehydrogenase
MERVRVALVGVGGIAEQHLLGYRAHADRVVLAAVAEADDARRALRSAELGVAGYPDLGSLLAAADGDIGGVDAVDVCLPHHLHRDAVVAAADAGKHVLCEKPLCLSAAEARDVRAAVVRNGVTLMCAHNKLFLPAVARAREVLDAGEIGAVYEVRTNDSFFNDFDPDTMGWRASVATSGGGELIDTGYHPTYLLLHLAGGVPVETTAMLSRHRLTFMEGEDSAQVLVRFDNGVVGHLATSWAYTAPPSASRFSVVGELGSLHTDQRGNELTVAMRDGDTRTETFEPVDTIAAEIGAFADAIRFGARPPHTEKEGIEVLGILLAAYESARTKTIAPVVIPS